MRLRPFTIHRADSVEQASGLLAESGDDAAAYCGGTELLLAMKMGLADYTVLVDLKPIAALRAIGVLDGVLDGVPAAVPGAGPGAAPGPALSIGAGATHRSIEASAEVAAWYPELAAMLSQIANLRVRATGTIGGNLCFADPHSDPAAFLIAIGAVAVCQRAATVRRVPVRDFFTGPYQTVLEPGELLIALELPPRPVHTGLAHLRMRLHERPAVTAVARIERSGGTVTAASLVLGALGAVPFPADEAAASLIGATTGPSATAGPGGTAGPGATTGPGATGGSADFAVRARRCAEAAAAACPVMDDGDISPDYLRHLAKVHAERALLRAFARSQT